MRVTRRNSWHRVHRSHEGVRDLAPRGRALDAEVTPQRGVFLPALDRHAERGPDDVRLEIGAIGEAPPPALLVDERLADVEDDRL